MVKRRKRVIAQRRRRGAQVLLCLCIGLVVWCVVAVPEPHSHAARTIRVYHVEQAQLMELDLESYLVGVIAAEMPASFALEALKAQAVAARTFAYQRMLTPNHKVQAQHPDAQITTSPATCQAWIDAAEQKRRWGRDYTMWRDKIEQAVRETAGEVLYYDGACITPVYHASCGGGSTESAEAVWGTQTPYLVSVPCNHPADKHSGAVSRYTLAEVGQKLNVQDAVAVSAAWEGEAPIAITETTTGHRVKTVRIGNQLFSGTKVRQALGLKSTLMTFAIAGGGMTITTSGYGHGVGMCQHGANYYAQNGMSYRQILQLYYPGTDLAQIGHAPRS